MTQTYFPFDSGAGASITEAQWYQMARKWLGSGVLPDELDELEVYADSSGMQVKVKSGQAWMEGHFYESDAEETLAIAAADASNPRIDRVVVRLDRVANTIALAVVTGTAAASPSAPALTQNSSTWELALAQVSVSAGATSIAAGDVTDERSYASNGVSDHGELTGLGDDDHPQYLNNGRANARYLLKWNTAVYTPTDDYHPATKKYVDDSVSGAALPAGTIQMFGGEVAPNGWLECNGAAVSRTTYADLFSAIGTAWGEGDGSTTFNIPDMRGVFPRGWDNGRGKDPDAASRVASATGGATGDHVGSYQDDEFKSHTHIYNAPNPGKAYDGTDRAANTVVANTGAAGGNETRGKNVYVMFIIKA